MKNIPLFDLSRQHASLKEKILKSWESIYDSNSFTSGNETKLLEKEFAKICNTKYSLGVHSGTDSLIIALKAAGIKKGDEVITTPCTFSASVDSILHVGATPVFTDVIPENGNIDSNQIKKKITQKTKALLIVHLYGIPCEMDIITDIAKKHNITIIEDASHAHGSLYKGKPVGSFGLAGCFSLYPSKSLGALGNAGMITSNNLKFINDAKMYANHGIKKTGKYVHHVSGFNKLIDNLQSGALIHKLPNLLNTINRKIKIADTYNQAFIDSNQIGMIWPDHTTPSIYIYSFQTKNREKVVKHFNQNGISIGIYYPIPIHLQPYMKEFKYKQGDFPKAETFFNQTLSLPSFAELTNEEIKIVANTIKSIPSVT